jgi:hypothetical protein
MAFYLRKSVKVGPLRFNLSKSGIGVSAGVRGLRFGAGPRGNYVHMGRHGVYYRATLPSGQGSPSPRPAPAPPPPPSADGMTEIHSGDIAAMVDSSSAELLAELNAKQKMLRGWPWVCAAFVAAYIVVLNASPGPSAANSILTLAVFGAGAVATYAAHRFDTLRRTTVLLYNLDADASKHYQALHDAFDTLSKCGGRWHVDAQVAVGDSKYHGGAGTSARRSAINLRTGAPSLVKTNIDVPVIPAGKNMLYFFPERLLVFGPSAIGAVGYESLKTDITSTRFVESGSIPADAQVVGNTWRYVNKGGGPDKRFKDNRQLPIALYEEIRFSSASGLNELLEVSKLGVGRPFADALNQLKTTPTYLTAKDIAPPAPAPTPVRTAEQEARDQQRRAEYEKEFPYDPAKPPDERLGRRSPTVSGGLPSLGKRR